jgi:hypothetical protein
VIVHHVPSCPSLARGGVHGDAGQSAREASERLNVALSYVRDGHDSGTVVGGSVTARQN